MINFGSGRNLTMNVSKDGEYIIIESIPSEEEVKKTLEEKKTFPPTAGVYLNDVQAEELLKHISRLHEEFIRMSCGKPVELFESLGMGMFLTSSTDEYRMFHIRKYYTCPKTSLLKPSRTGIALREQEVLGFVTLYPSYVVKMQENRANNMGERVKEACKVVKVEGPVRGMANPQSDVMSFEDITDEEMSTLEVGSEDFEDGQRVESDE